MIKPVNRNDFIVRGENPVTGAAPDANVLTLFSQAKYESGVVSFVEGDSFSTFRGLGFPADRARIEALYGKGEVQEADLSTDRVYLAGEREGNGDVRCLTQAAQVLVYVWRQGQLRFYVDGEERLLLAAYCLNYGKIPV